MQDSPYAVKLLSVLIEIFGSVAILSNFVSPMDEVPVEFNMEHFLQTFNSDLIPWCLQGHSNSSSLKLDLLLDLFQDECFSEQWCSIINHSIKQYEMSDNSSHIEVLAMLIEKVRERIRTKTLVNLQRSGFFPERWRHNLLDSVAITLAHHSPLGSCHAQFLCSHTHLWLETRYPIKVGKHYSTDSGGPRTDNMADRYVPPVQQQSQWNFGVLARVPSMRCMLFFSHRDQFHIYNLLLTAYFHLTPFVVFHLLKKVVWKEKYTSQTFFLLVQVKETVFADENFSVSVNRSASEIIATYKKEETGMDLVIRLPNSYPLRPVDVECTRSLGISEVRQRKWLLSLTAFIRNQVTYYPALCLVFIFFFSRFAVSLVPPRMG
ncbi:hypothetical protein BHM03_00030432, partial [Ensete ventricosum]